jgi:spore maturation protein CgeB
MRILMLTYERGVDLEDFTLPTGKRIQHQVMYTDCNEIEKEGLGTVLAWIREFKPELIIEREFNDGKAIYTDILNEFPNVKKAAWLIDTHCSWERHSQYAKQFDYIFLAISKFVEPIKKAVEHDRVYWLPLCYPTKVSTIRPNYGPVKCPVSFVGRFGKSHPTRTLYLSALAERYGGDFLCVTDYDRANAIIRSSKISFNYSLDDDLNFRVWEVLGAGTELVTDSVTDLHKVKGLEHRVHVFKNIDEMIELTDRILADDPSTTKNALDNQNWVKQKHCLIHRHLAMLDMIEHGSQHEY